MTYICRMKFTYLFFLLAMPIIAFSQTISIAEITEAVEFDGNPSEAFWSKLTPINTTQHIPRTGSKTSESETIHVGYNKDYFYLGAVIQGANIMSPSKKRDEFSLKPDWIGIILDSYNDKENALGFFTTPDGLRSDFTVFEDAVGEFPVNLDWNTYWDVKTTRSENEWTVEMRIPFSSLQFQDKDGSVEMGLIVWRAIASHNEIDTWPPIENKWGDFSAFKPSKAQRISFKGVKSAKPIYITPYILAGGDRIVGDIDPFDANLDGQLSAGLDVKYNITSNLTMDVSLNTDFAQVEADDAQVNLDRFDLFFPEKRQFFQERASIFDLRIGGTNRVFYSRRIGIDDDGNLEKILGGLRLTGRVGDLDVGVINMTTRNDQWSPKNNFSVLRVRKKVLNDNSYIGVIGTNKVDFNGEFNSVYAVDGTFRLKGNNLFQMRLAQSFTEGYENNALSLAPTRLFINLEKTQSLGFAYDLALARMGEDYNPELGFESRDNYSSAFAIIGYGWRRSDESKILQQEVRMYNFGFFKNDTGLDETLNTGVSFGTQWKTGDGFEIFTYLRTERLREDVDILDDYTVSAGLYNINVWAASYNSPGTNRFQYNIGLRGGDIFDSKFIAINQGAEIVVTPELSFGLVYNYNPIFKLGWDAEEVVHVHLARLKFLYTLSTKVSLTGFIQGTSDGNIGLGNIRFRYNPREGVDLFVVYNNVTDLDLVFGEKDFRRGVPEQVLITKFTYTFRL